MLPLVALPFHFFVMVQLQRIGKDKVINHHHDVPYKVLNKSYTFWEENSWNKIIHGDNLEALKSLLPQYEWKIDCIYIDPPYNTWNEWWVYNDNVNDPKIKKRLNEVVGKEWEDLSRHDKWLCMMYPRLKLLHKLLSDKWAIFISIDDNEQSNLKLLCDEIFWSSNFITNIVIENDSRARPYNSIAITHEYLLIYQKSWNFTANILEDPEKKFKYYDDEWWFDLYELRNRNSDFNIDNRPNLYYPFYLNPKNKDSNDLYEIDLNGHEWWIEVYPKESQWIKTVWRRWKERAYNWLNKIIFWKKASEWWQIVKKYRESTYSLNSVWTDWKFSSDRWTLTLKSYFNNKRIFAFPKPIELVQQCLSLASKKNSVILDSFAWSWTTAHAVLDLNKQDWGNRKFILVELWDYAENITAERVKRVINWYGEWDKKVEWIWWGFDFYELWEPLFLNNETLNENVGEETLRDYIRYSETKTEIQKRESDNKYYLGTNFDTDYYFYYEKERVTELNYDFLAKINREKNHWLIIYADICSLSDDFLKNNNIIFKKIPRDISQF